MNDTLVFVIGVGLTAAVSTLVVLVLARPLIAILVELCGTRERAVFWAALSRVVFIAFPLIFALHVQPEPDSGVPLVLALATQLEWALIGIVAASVVLGLVLGAFIPKAPPRGSTVGSTVGSSAPGRRDF